MGLLELARELESQFETVSPSQRTEREDVHFTYSDGYSHIHVIVYKRRANDDSVLVRVSEIPCMESSHSSSASGLGLAEGRRFGQQLTQRGDHGRNSSR